MRRSAYIIAVCSFVWSASVDQSELFAMQRKSGRAVEAVSEAAVVAAPAGAVAAPGGAPAGAPANSQPMPNAGATPAAGAPVTPPGAKPLTREEKPKKPADPAELAVRPDAQGKVRFNFQGQPWLDVLEWLAKISNLSLDWQEMPGDHLNLATQRSYSVVEARDLINRHLLDRGYTMLRNGEVLTVVNVKKLDPGLVPRVKPEDLKARDPHEFVKVSFALDWMIAEQAVEELKPMLSQNGKLTALRTTNRVEAMDSVTNLREIFEVLQDEQSRDGQEQLVKEFRLQHIRAIDADVMLRDLLGMQTALRGGGGGGGGGGGNDHMQQQMFQMQQQMMQQVQQLSQGGGGGRPGGGGGAGPEKKVYLVVNTRRNSILAQAPADKMAVIVQAVKTLDVDTGEGGNMLEALNNTKIYRLAAIDPEPFVRTLTELGNLDPRTQIKVDRENTAIIVSGPLADHYIITELLKKLDGTDRRFEVIRLRRLEAEYVAGTIELMMGGGEKKKDDNPYMGWRYGFEMGGGQKKEAKKFKVSADTENNRLLLWINDIELREIHFLLEKLGEVPPREGNPDTLRVFDMGTPEEAEKFLEKLRQLQPDLVPADETVRRKRPAAVDSSKSAPEARRSPRPDTTPQPARNQAATPRRPGQSGRILQGGKPVPQVTLARLQEPPVKDREEADVPYPKSLPDPESMQSEIFKRRLRRAIEEFQTIMPTFAPENPSDTTVEATEPAPEVPAAEEPVLEEPARQPSEPRAPQQQSKDPVQVTVTEDGRLVISSANTQALDTLEETIGRMAPPRRDFKIFHIKNRNVWISSVVLNLEEYFGTEEKKKDRPSYDYYYGYYNSGSSKDTSPRTLSKKRIPKFIYDIDSRTILVTGADPEQLRTIQELIDIYDRPEEGVAKAQRLNRVIQLKYSRARVIADAVKEVYRDLLSENDPALQQQQQNGKDRKPVSSERTYTYIYGADTNDKGKEPEAPIKFKGLLSLGVDEISNTIIVSSQEGLLENIGQLIEALDNAARPTQTTIQVLRVDRSIEASGLQSRLAKILTRPQPQPPQQGQQPQQNGGRNPNQPQPNQAVEAAQVAE